MRIHATIATALLCCVLLVACGDDDGGGDENLFLSDTQLNIAHRGGNRLAPEETLEAWRSALAVGADVLEMDLHATSDGVLILQHDDTVDRTTDGSGRISEMTWAAASQLDAGYDYTRDSGETYPFRGQGLKIPTLEEVFAEFPDQYMIIEIKQREPSIVDAFDELLTRMNMRDRVIVASFDDAVIQEFRAVAPDVLTSYALQEAVTFAFLPEDQEAGYTPPAGFLHVPTSFDGLEVLSPENVARARRFNVKFHVWTINRADEMRELLDLGVDGIMTDDPATLEEIISEGDQ